MTSLNRLLRAALGIVLLSVLIQHAGFAQAVSGNIIGTVTDPSGAAVPQADVNITDVDRGLAHQTRTNADGNYIQTHLLAGHYEVKVTATGFSEFVAKADVQVDASTRVDATLALGRAASTVNVSAETPMLETDRSEVSTTLTGGELEKLPVLDRNLTELLLVMPGAQMNGWQHASSENPQGGIQINVNGQFFFTNGFLIDGTENNSAILGIAVINPNLDSLQDFKVSTSNYDAEFGQASGAMMQATTKAGTNRLHGSLFEYLRNDKLNAADPFAGLRPPLRWNQFGGSMGGPLRKDKLFGFFDYQGTRRHTGGALITTVPTKAERAGDLRALLGVYICTDAAHPMNTTSPTPCSGEQAPFVVQTTEGSQVPAQAGTVFDPASGSADGSGRKAISTGGEVNIMPSVAAPMTKLLDFLPPPNSGTDIVNNYVAAGVEIFSNDQYDGRLDYNLSEKSRIFGRYTISDFTKHAPGAFGEEAGGPAFTGFNFAGASLARNQSFALGYTYTISSTLVADFRFGAYRYRVRVQPNGVGTTPAADAGLPGLNTGTPETSGMPAFYISSDGGFDFGYALGVNQCNCPLKETENHFQWVNNWTKEKGNHTIKWGADIRRAQQQRVPSDSHRSGEITFTDGVTGNADADNAAAGNATTGSAIASYLLGIPSNFARYFTGAGFYPGLRQTRLFFFAQDSWRATPKLTVNYGLRYENYLPQVAAKPGGAGTFDPSTGEVMAACVGSVPCSLGIKAYNAGFAPRLGLAYQLRPTTIVRAGFGQSYNASALGAVFGQSPDYDPPITNGQQENQPNIYAPAFPGSLLTGPPLPPNPPVGANGRYPLPDGINVYYFVDPPSSYRIPLAEFWNLTVQHQFRPSLTAEAAYVGNVGRHLYTNPNTNQAVPGPGDLDPRRRFFKFGLTQGIFAACNCDNSSYNALQAKVQKRASNGLDLLLTYTYSKAMTNSEGGYGYSDNLNIRGDHGPAGWDHAHALTLTHSYDLPVGRGRRWASAANRFLDAMVGGWRFNGVTTLLSEPAFTPYVSNAPLLNTDFNSVRPDIVGNPHVSDPNRDLWFNPNAYTSPQQPFHNGTASKGSLRGPAQYLLDLALVKEFVIREGKTIEFRWENFNALNHTNLGLPDATVDESGAGQITYAATGMRQMQFGLHFRF